MTRMLLRTRLTAALAAPVLAAGALSALAPADLVAAAQAAGGGPCYVSGPTVTCTFKFTGSVQTWVVPAGVTSAVIQTTGLTGPGASGTEG